MENSPIKEKPTYGNSPYKEVPLPMVVQLINSDEDLNDDIEDKHATYSEYSIAKG